MKRKYSEQHLVPQPLPVFFLHRSRRTGEDKKRVCKRKCSAGKESSMTEIATENQEGDGGGGEGMRKKSTVGGDFLKAAGCNGIITPAEETT